MSSVRDKGGDGNGNKSEYESEVCEVIEILDDDNDESSVQDKGGDGNGNKSGYESEVREIIEILGNEDVLTFASSRGSVEPLRRVSD